MTLGLALLAGLLTAVAVYLLLERHSLRVVLGLSLLSNAINVAILTAGGAARANAAIVREGASTPVPPWSEPLPQALVLTAIVISFGVTVFLVALLVRHARQGGGADVDVPEDEDPRPAAGHEAGSRP